MISQDWIASKRSRLEWSAIMAAIMDRAFYLLRTDLVKLESWRERDKHGYPRLVGLSSEGPSRWKLLVLETSLAGEWSRGRLAPIWLPWPPRAVVSDVSPDSALCG